MSKNVQIKKPRPKMSTSGLGGDLTTIQQIWILVFILNIVLSSLLFWHVLVTVKMKFIMYTLVLFHCYPTNTVTVS